MNYFESRRNQLVSGMSILGICNGEIPILYTEASNTKKYADGKPTDEYEFSIIKCQAKQLGELKLLFPYAPGLAEQFNSQLEFGDLFKIPDIGTVEEVSIGIYKERLNFKFYCTQK